MLQSVYDQSKSSILTSATTSTMSKYDLKVIRIPKRDSPPIEDRYGGYKSNSQIFFTDTLHRIRKWSLWHTVMFVILTWNFFIYGLQLTPLLVDYMEDNIRCKVHFLENTNWTFDQIKNISHYRNATSRCYYHVRNYHDLSQFPYEVAYNIVRYSTTHRVKTCSKYVLRVPDSRYNYLDKFNLLCTPNYLKLYHFMALGQMIGYIASGFIADIYGRRTALLAALPVSVVASILTAISPTYWLMYLFTTIAVASLYGSSAITMIMFLEIIHFKIRYFTFSFVLIGHSLGRFVKMTLSRLLKFENQWAINCSFLMPICMLWLLPESPHWLLCYKQWKQLQELFNEISYPTIVPPYLSDTDELERPLVLISAKEIMCILLKPAFRKHLFLGVFLFALTTFMQYTETARVIHITNSGATYAAINGMCVIVSILFVPMLLKNMGRPMCICCSLLVLAFFYCSTTIYKPYSTSGFVAACICLILAETSVLVNILLISETFPTRVRGTAFGISRSVGTTIVLVSTLVNNYTEIQGAVGIYGWTIYAAVILVAAFICVFVTDTGDVPLPDTEMQAILHF